MKDGFKALMSVAAVALLCASVAAQAASPPAKPAAAAPQQNDKLAIENEAALPKTFAHNPYSILLKATGVSVPPLQWKLESGKLPPGVELKDNGFLVGTPQHSGIYQFVISVSDNANPRHAVQRQFTLEVQDALMLVWKTQPHVNGNRIEGNVEISNVTGDDMDLTFVVLAVAEDGRATAIGYQHFPLKHGTFAQRIDFGQTLPHGAYVVHADAVGEVASSNAIYRQRLQTPNTLQVALGP